MLNIALPKGRLGNQVYRLFAEAGCPCAGMEEDNRRLVFENEEAGVRYLLVKPSDVAIYVERGAADIGVVGLDCMLESQPDVYELLDLGLGKCRFVMAAPLDYVEDTDRVLRVATKYVNVTRNYFASRNREIDIIKLHGSIELAPILGLSDVIVDITETGSTLKENQLRITAEILPVSARLIANKAGYKFKAERIAELAARLAERI